MPQTFKGIPFLKLLKEAPVLPWL